MISLNLINLPIYHYLYLTIFILVHLITSVVCIVSELGQRYKSADVERLELKSLITNADSIRRYIHIYACTNMR
jgi:hypothetical protein